MSSGALICTATLMTVGRGRHRAEKAELAFEIVAVEIISQEIF